MSDLVRSASVAQTAVLVDAERVSPADAFEETFEDFAKATGLGIVCLAADGGVCFARRGEAPLLALLCEPERLPALRDFERELAERCRTAAESCEASFIELLRVRALPLESGAVVLFGYCMSRFATSHDALRMAHAQGTSQARALAVLRDTQPVSPQRFAVYAELLETLLTARQRHLAAVREHELQNRTRELLLAHVSHELRAPIMSSALRIQLLLDSKLSDETELRRQLSLLRSSVADEAHLIEDLIETARSRSGQLHLDLALMRLTPVLERSLEGIAPRAERKQQNLALAVLGADAAGGDEDLLYADAARLGQVFSNLLANAVKFTPAGGRIDVQLHVQAQTLEVHVADTGCGIEPELLGRVFDAFTQARPGSHKGLGLGLSVAKQLVLLHGGEIRAESAGSGRGATFVVSLPRASEPQLASRPQLLAE